MPDALDFHSALGPQPWNLGPGKTRRRANPALDQTLDQIRMIAQQHAAGTLDRRQERSVARKISNAHGQLAGLARAENFARSAQLEVLLGDAETVAAFTQHIQALAR